MSVTTAERVLEWLSAHHSIETVDITGGSPELNPNFRRLVAGCRSLGRHVMDRCNPTIIATGYDWVPNFLATNEVEVVASMPCYLQENVQYQRGKTSFGDSIDGLRALNAVGYGRDPNLLLQLVYNPNGPVLPPPQSALANDYHRELESRYGIVFNELWTITNMPIRRWADHLRRQGQLDHYQQLLRDSFNPDAIDSVMCRSQIHIDSQGRLFDCDFNYAVELAANLPARYLWETTPEELANRSIATAEHCFGCTAGAGSSCGGAIVSSSQSVATKVLPSSGA